MVLEKNTILITGGSSGIGLELAKILTEKNNTVIICGRSAEKLQKARQAIPGIGTFQCDVSRQNECEKMASWIKEKYPRCNVLINNAAIVHKTDFYQDAHMIAKAGLEISTNLIAPVMLSKLLIPVLEQNSSSKIINITTGLIYAPKAAYPIYNATKAALHAFTQVLRIQMRNHPVSIIEVMFPAVDTPWHTGKPPKFAIPAGAAVKEMIKKIEKGQSEIKIGKVKLLYRLSRIAPSFALKQINKT